MRHLSAGFSPRACPATTTKHHGIQGLVAVGICAWWYAQATPQQRAVRRQPLTPIRLGACFWLKTSLEDLVDWE